MVQLLHNPLCIFTLFVNMRTLYVLHQSPFAHPFQNHNQISALKASKRKG